MDKHQNSITISKDVLLLCRKVLFSGIGPFFSLQVFHFYDEDFDKKKFQDNYHMSQQNK